jgi:hypothetical protein
MPFPQQNPRAFTKANIEAITPGQKGVYGIFRNQGPWIYVGSGDIRERLLAHFYGDNPDIIKAGPTHWVDEVTANNIAREKALIVECQPVANKKVG